MQFMHKQFYTLQEFKMKAFSYSFTLLSGQFKKHINLKIVQKNSSKPPGFGTM